MCTFKRIAVSNRGLYQRYHGTERIEDYVNHLEMLAQTGHKPDMLILREKELSEPAYGRLLDMVRQGLEHSGVELMPHTYLKAAKNSGIPRIHLPFRLLKQYVETGEGGISVYGTAYEPISEKKILQEMEMIGTSVHSVEEAVEAERMGASYVTAGHIFTTDCKPGLEPRGLEFLQRICENVRIPVYAIGGIHPENMAAIEKAGAAGACMMSEYMRQ